MAAKYQYSISFGHEKHNKFLATYTGIDGNKPEIELQHLGIAVWFETKKIAQKTCDSLNELFYNGKKKFRVHRFVWDYED